MHSHYYRPWLLQFSEVSSCFAASVSSFTSMALDSTASVGESINCIVDAFEASATSFRKWRQRRRKRRPGETELLTSLESGALDVRVDYEKHFRKYGPQFGAGDGILRQSLVKIFKTLNHSIVHVLNRAANEPGSASALEPSALWNISEKVRNCALMAMIELSHRIRSGALLSSSNFQVYASDQLQASNITLLLETSSITEPRVEVPVIYTTGTATSFRERTSEDSNELVLHRRPSPPRQERRARPVPLQLRPGFHASTSTVNSTSSFSSANQTSTEMVISTGSLNSAPAPATTILNVATPPSPTLHPSASRLSLMNLNRPASSTAIATYSAASPGSLSNTSFSSSFISTTPMLSKSPLYSGPLTSRSLCTPPLLHPVTSPLSPTYSNRSPSISLSPSWPGSPNPDLAKSSSDILEMGREALDAKWDALGYFRSPVLSVGSGSPLLGSQLPWSNRRSVSAPETSFGVVGSYGLEIEGLVELP